MRRRSIIMFITVLCLINLCRKNPAASLIVSDIGLYTGGGTWSESIPALKSMFHWMGYSVTELFPEDMVHDELSNFKVICFPGGDMFQYAQDIGHDGIANLRQALWDGTGYIGICGGAYFAASRVQWLGNPLSMISLNLFSGQAQGPHDVIVSYPDYNMCTVNITDTVHAITASLEPVMRILYYWGPSFTPDASAQVSILGRYEANDRAAMLAFLYGKGRIFIIGTHPEIEEDSDRDHCHFAEGLEDEGSDWNLMERAAAWCTGKSQE